jgi:hypothetical protein
MRVLALVLAAGCATAPVRDTVMPGVLEDVAYGPDAVGAVGTLRVRRMPDGAVRVDRPGAHPVVRVDDAALEAAVRTRLALDPAADKDLDVDASGGVVRLAGPATDAAHAARAVLLTMSTPGVVAVDSRLSWVSAGAARTTRR